MGRLWPMAPFSHSVTWGHTLCKERGKGEKWCQRKEEGSLWSQKRGALGCVCRSDEERVFQERESVRERERVRKRKRDIFIKVLPGLEAGKHLASLHALPSDSHQVDKTDGFPRRQNLQNQQPILRNFGKSL